MIDTTNPIVRIRRSETPGKQPLPNQLLLGELALNTYDGDLFALRNRTGFSTDVVRIGAGATVTNVLYVTKDGNDNNTGRKLGDAKATIKSAVSIAEPGTVIKVSAGTYIEDNPIYVPDQVSIVGDSLREVTVTPQNSGDLFYIGAGNYFQNMSFVGAPNPGAIFSFDPVSIRYIAQSPYLQNCTNFIPDSIGLKIDGKNAIGPLKSMVLDSYTQYNQGGIGVSITNEGYAQLVSLFTICNDVAVYCGSGGACDLTNSNSSFGNYALVADGVGPLKYTGIVTSTVQENFSTITVNLNTPTFGITSALYDNYTGILTAYTSVPHNFSVGMGVSLSSLKFKCSGITGTTYYPSGKYGYIFDIKTVAPGRYVDSYNLIQKNKREIQDKSLASIGIAYSDFYFPGDKITNSRSRYYDAYRLIQKNKDVIVGIAWTNTYNVYPGISTTMNKCKRDLGYFIDAISTDVFTGGNKYARDFVKQYFNNGNPISNGLVGEESESIYAFNEARKLMKNAITNNLVGAAYSDLTVSAGTSTYNGGGTVYPNTSPNACFDVQTNIDNLVGIVTVSIASSTLSLLPNENLGSFTMGGNKCFRDIGYLIDAVSVDVRDYTNLNTINFIKNYFDINGDPLINGITGEVSESIVAFNSVRDYSKKAITNQLNNKDLTIVADPVTGFNTDPNSCSNVQTFIDNLISTVNSNTVGIATNKMNLPSVSMASTVFTVNVGLSTTPNQVYDSGGTVNINNIRPFDGQVVYFDRVYYTVESISIIDGGSGYTETPTIIIDSPQTDWGVTAQAIASIQDGKLLSVDVVSSGRGYTSTPKINVINNNAGVTTAKISVNISPTYSVIRSSTPISAGICTITLSDNVPYSVGIGTVVSFFKQSRVLASGHSLEYIGSGTTISLALPSTGGVPIQNNETNSINGGLVVFTSTDQSGNFRIGDGVVINQQDGTISGNSYSRSLFSTLTPFILALGGE